MSVDSELTFKAISYGVNRTALSDRLVLSLKKFPKERVLELVEIISAEISMESLKVGSRELLNDNR